MNVLPDEKKPGIYSDVSFKEYLEEDRVSNTYLGKLDVCPAKALVEDKDTDALSLGRAVHTLVLEGEEAFYDRYAIAPKCDKRTKVGKEAYAMFVETVAGKEIVTKDDEEKAIAIRGAVHTHPLALRLLEDGVREQTVYWIEGETRIRCKTRPDILPDEGKRTLVDLKTTRGASETWFTRAIVNYGYARGAAFYLDSMNFFKPVGSKFYDSFVFIAVETTEPYRVECYVVDDEFIEYGREEYKRLLGIHNECMEIGIFPHWQNDELTQIYKPHWL